MVSNTGGGTQEEGEQGDARIKARWVAYRDVAGASKSAHSTTVIRDGASESTAQSSLQSRSACPGYSWCGRVETQLQKLFLLPP